MDGSTGREEPAGRLPVGGVIVLLILVMLLLAGCTSPMNSPPPIDVNASAAPLQVAIRAEPARYSPVMSSTVGIRLSAVNTSGIMPPDARIRWETEFGHFVRWGPPDYRVVELGPRYTGGDEPVYWTFFSDVDEEERQPVRITLQVVQPSGTAMARADLTLTWDDPMIVVVPAGAMGMPGMA